MLESNEKDMTDVRSLGASDITKRSSDGGGSMDSMQSLGVVNEKEYSQLRHLVKMIKLKIKIKDCGCLLYTSDAADE